MPAIKTIHGGGQIGIFVDGVAMFNSWDAYYWNGSTRMLKPVRHGYWNRDAYVNEGVTFDAGYAHQQQTGVYHYHADPIALRYLLGDHVDYNPATKTYSEDTNTPTKHSPILAWTADGFPLYGPYGYSNPTNAGSGIRRMVSGYVLRNGQNGTDNLDYNGAARTTIPAMGAAAFRRFSRIKPARRFHSSYPFGRYMEDNDYLGDLINPPPARITSKAWILIWTNTTVAGASRRNFPTALTPTSSRSIPTACRSFPTTSGARFTADPVGGSRLGHLGNCRDEFSRQHKFDFNAEFAGSQQWNRHIDLERTRRRQLSGRGDDQSR